MDAADWLEAWLDRRWVHDPGRPDLDVPSFVAECRQDAVFAGIDAQELEKAAGGDLLAYLKSNMPA